MDWLGWLLQIILTIILVLYFLNQRYNYWSQRGIQGPKGLPFLGNMWEQLLKGQLACELEWMTKYGKIYGTYNGFKPTLTIIDSDLIKQVMVKDFGLFVNRRKNRSDHEIWGRNLFGAEGDDWKRIRTITSPAFTSGKLRNMTVLMNRCVDRLVSYFDKICSATGSAVINTKEVISGFSIDVIASTSFATETNTNGDRDRPSAFVTNGMKVFLFHPIRILVLTFVPAKIRKWFGYTLNLDPVSFDFFVQLSKKVMRDRRETSTGKSQNKRNDLVQFLMDARVSENDLKGSDYEHLTATSDETTDDKEQSQESGQKSLTDNEIIAQCILFFVAGFETTASTLSHCLFELAKTPEAQEKLYKSFSVLDGLNQASDEYFHLVMNRIPYLEAVIKETLRMYPPVPRLNRRVNVDGYRLGNIVLNKDQGVEIPAYAVHYNPDYYPEPEKFNPDRFLPENKDFLVPYTYLPFGQGPRNCVGMRFALQEIKLCLARIITGFRFTPTTETPEKLQFSKIGLMSVKNFPLNVSKRG